ncbi:hypothetical protein V6N13_043987 [Hibiscus sabdariffa]
MGENHIIEDEGDNSVNSLGKEVGEIVMMDIDAFEEVNQDDLHKDNLEIAVATSSAPLALGKCNSVDGLSAAKANVEFSVNARTQTLQHLRNSDVTLLGARGKRKPIDPFEEKEDLCEGETRRHYYGDNVCGSSDSEVFNDFRNNTKLSFPWRSNTNID